MRNPDNNLNHNHNPHKFQDKQSQQQNPYGSRAVFNIEIAKMQ
jgi:hypothetical protein